LPRKHDLAETLSAIHCPPDYTFKNWHGIAALGTIAALNGSPTIVAERQFTDAVRTASPTSQAIANGSIAHGPFSFAAPGRYSIKIGPTRRQPVACMPFASKNAESTRWPPHAL